MHISVTRNTLNHLCFFNIPSRFLLIATISCLLHSVPAWSLEKVTLQLKWRHDFVFAGYYAAVEKGYYKEAGLDVELIEAGLGVDSLQSVLAGHAQYGVGSSSLLMAHKEGKPVVVLAAIFQHSPLVLIARDNKQNQGTQAIHDLIGKRVMIEPQSDELIAYLKQEKVSLDHMVLVPHSFQPDELIAGEVDAISAYVSNEPYYMDRAKIAYQTYTPRSVGIDFYGDNLFTTQDEIKNHPLRVRAFRDASLRGWQYAMQHPEEIADLIIAKYSKQHSRDFYLFEATRMAPLMRTDLIEIGYMSLGRWRHIANTYADIGMLPANYNLQGFLYEPDTNPDLTKLYIVLALFVAVSGIAFYILRINRKLSVALNHSRAAEEHVRHLAQHDTLTKLPNRALFSDRLNQALIKAKRDQQRLAVLFLDLDKFKPVNDTLGHEVGDSLLQQAAIRLRNSLRESDTVARVGGDEFIVLLRNVKDSAETLAVANKLCASLVHPFNINQHSINISVSIGIALYPDHGLTDFELLKHADAAMYQAKRNGQNRVEMYGAVQSS